MASTYSQYLRLELIGTGEQTGTWGNTTNTNLGTLLDQAVAGTATIDVTVGDVTLTALNGASDQSRQAILKITGTPAAARNVIAPESSKWYLVSNDCGKTITLKGASTSGYAIATGETLLMFWDGTDFVPGSSTALGYTPVNKAGDTMTGALYLPAATPTISTQAANKAYVDAAVSGAVGSNFVLKTGDTMTGPLVLSGAPTLSTQAANKGYVDGAISGAGYATQAWVLSQSYVTTSTSSLTNYYTKTDSDSRYVSTSTQNLQYYPLTTTVASTYATKVELGNYVTSTYLTTNYSTTAQINTALSSYVTTTYLTSNYSTTTAINSALATYMPKAGGTFTGNVTLGSGVSLITGTGPITVGTGGIISQAFNFTASNSIYYNPGSAVVAITNGSASYVFNNAGTATAVSWTSTSDARLKENVQPVTSGLSLVSQLNPVKYSFKRDQLAEPNRYGLIAQELETVIPEVVDTGAFEQDGVADVKSVAYAELIPILVKAIQELKAEVDALKAAA